MGPLSRPDVISVATELLFRLRLSRGTILIEARHLLWQAMAPFFAVRIFWQNFLGFSRAVGVSTDGMS
jgi:hypothetical protein